MIDRSRSSFESINARSLTPVQVAKTFVPSPHFEELCRRRHSIVLGPRGSGKTTLLKMLQPIALSNWRHPDAAKFAGAIDFTGIFVAADISWSEQLNGLGLGSLDSESSHLLSLACFTTHALKAIIVAFQQRLEDNRGQSTSSDCLTIEAEIEAAVVSNIARSWHVTGISPSFFSLRQAMTHRLLRIRELSSQEAILGESGRAVRLASTSFLHLRFLEAAAYAIETFEEAMQLPAGKWAYAFDELELAPEPIQRELIQSIRSTDDRFLFKLALNPFTQNTYLLQNALSPAPGQDFDQISLWYSEKRVALSFCEGLWRELTKENDLLGTTANSVLGRSYFESSTEDLEERRSAYAPGSRWAKRFRALAAKDPSFREYIRRRSIDLQGLHLMDDDQRAAEVRKIAPIVALRDFYLRESDPDREPTGLRSRKTAELYTGADSIFAVTEGNPRIFIGLVSLLLATAKGRSTLSVPPQIQADKLLASAEKFLATLRTIPVQNNSGHVGIGVVNLLRKIARYFHDDAVKGPFKAAPVGSFTVDSQISEAVLNTLTQALNAGAIIYVPEDEGSVILTSLRGKKFRLSYLLAPLYGFPIRLGPDIALSRILGLQRSDDASSETLPLGFSQEA